MEKSLLVICPIEPRRIGNGLAMRTARTISSAARDFDVHVAVLPIAGGVPGTAGRLDSPCHVIAPVEGARLRREFTRLVANPPRRALLARADPLPRLARAVCTQVDEVIERCGVPAGTPVHVIRSYLAPLGHFIAEQLDAPWTTLDLDDDDEAFASATDPGEAAAYHRLVANFAPKFDAICAASRDEASVIGARHGLSIRPLVNAVDLPRSPRRTVRTTPNVLFVGNLTYRPNVDAAEFLAHHVLPILRTRLNGPVELTIVGTHSPDGPIAKLRHVPGVTVTGFVEDLEPYYALASVAVAPLRAGAGTRIKLLEAFAHRLPVVASPIAVAGLDVAPGVQFLSADSAASFADAVLRILSDQALADAVATSAYTYVEATHSPATFKTDLTALFDDARHRGQQRRQGDDDVALGYEPVDSKAHRTS